MNTTPNSSEGDQSLYFQTDVQIDHLSRIAIEDQYLNLLEKIIQAYAASRTQSNVLVVRLHVSSSFLLSAQDSANLNQRELCEEDWTASAQEMLCLFSRDKETCLSNIALNKEQVDLLLSLQSDERKYLLEARINIIDEVCEEAHQHLQEILANSDFDHDVQGRYMLDDWAPNEFRDRFLSDKGIQQLFGTKQEPKEHWDIAERIIDLECTFIRDHVSFILKGMIHDLQEHAESDELQEE